MAGPKAHIFVQETADAVSASVSENEQKLTDWAEVSHSTTEPASVLIHGIQHKKSSNVAEAPDLVAIRKKIARLDMSRLCSEISELHEFTDKLVKQQHEILPGEKPAIAAFKKTNIKQSQIKERPDGYPTEIFAETVRKNKTASALKSQGLENKSCDDLSEGIKRYRKSETSLASGVSGHDFYEHLRTSNGTSEFSVSASGPNVSKVECLKDVIPTPISADMEKLEYDLRCRIQPLIKSFASDLNVIKELEKPAEIRGHPQLSSDTISTLMQYCERLLLSVEKTVLSAVEDSTYVNIGALNAPKSIKVSEKEIQQDIKHGLLANATAPKQNGTRPTWMEKIKTALQARDTKARQYLQQVTEATRKFFQANEDTSLGFGLDFITALLGTLLIFVPAAALMSLPSAEEEEIVHLLQVFTALTLLFWLFCNLVAKATKIQVLMATGSYAIILLLLTGLTVLRFSL